MFSTPTTLKVLGVLSLGLVAGCGALEPFATTIAIPATASADGYVDDFPGAYNNSVDGIKVGDTWLFASTMRGIVRFNLAAIPPGATILSATLRVHQSSVVGAPYTALGDMAVDHVDIGAALSTGDLNSIALDDSFGTISTTDTVGFKELNVKDQLLDDLANGRANSDFRLHFVLATDGDFTTEFVRINDAENHLGDGNVPYLIIEYL